MHVLRIRPAAAAAVAAVTIVIALALWQVQSARPVVEPVATGQPLDQTLQLRDYSFTPAALRVTSGQRLRLTLVNEGREVHELEIEPFDWEVTNIRPGEQVTVVFTAPPPGVYEIACHKPGHYERGMKGTLVVEADRP